MSVRHYLRLCCGLLGGLLLAGAAGAQPEPPVQATEGVWAGMDGERPALITFADSPLLRALLAPARGPLAQVLAEPARYQLQLIYTQVTRDRRGRPQLQHHSLGLDTSRVFFTASLVKLPTAALALEALRRRHWSAELVALHLGAASPCQAADSAAYRPLTIGALIDRSFVVSDNPAFNRLFEWLGPRQLERELARRGYTSPRLRHRYASACWADPLGGAHLNPLSLREGRETLLTLPARHESVLTPHTLRTTSIDGFDFSRANFINLADLHRTLLALYVPRALPAEQRFELKADDYRRLHRAMAALPTQVDSPWFDTTYYTAARMKYLLAGGSDDTLAALRADSVLIFNKVGLGYGFLTDCAYVVDFRRRREFFLSAVIYTNADGVIGDDRYEYATIGLPALGELGRLVLAHERQRPLAHPPRLDALSRAWGRPRRAAPVQ